MRFPTLVRRGAERPIIAVTIESGLGLQFASDALVDMGSDITLFPIRIAEYLKINLTNIAESSIQSVLGSTAAYRACEVVLELRRPPEVFRWRGRVGFTPRNMTYGILGTRGFFEFFNVAYHLREHWLDIDPAGPLPL